MALLPKLQATTDGPDSRNSLGPCSDCKDHHQGIVLGVQDYCCCCDPCRYYKTKSYDTTGTNAYELYDLGSSDGMGVRLLKSQFCCRCVPQAIIASFIPDATASPCCKPLYLPLLAILKYDNPFPRVIYTGKFGLIDVTITNLDTGVEAGLGSVGPCKWRLTSTYLGISQEFVVDHANGGCLEFQGEIPSVTIPSIGTDCPGKIVFGKYEPVKIPFINRWHDGTNPYDPYGGSGPDISLATSPCQCTQVARILCVTGRRHAGGPVETVEFFWDETVKYWKYLPPCGDPTTDREVIYLRGDVNGNCYLELDTEQSGPWTNDWADPPNTLGPDEQEVRPGMIPISTCGCGLFVTSETTENRFVRIHGGYCTRYKYICGSCRCVPSQLCVIGEVDGTFVNTLASWNGSGWSLTIGTQTVRLQLAKPNCPPPLTGEDEDVCAIAVEGTFSTPFEKSPPIQCGKFLMFEVYSTWSIGATTFNWLWASAKWGGCTGSVCGDCVIDRCGGMPAVVYADLHAIGIPRMDNPLTDPTVCDLTVPLYWYQRWGLFPNPVLLCGWVGYTTITCDTGPAVIRVWYSPIETGGVVISRQEQGGPWTDWFTQPLVELVSCDPYIKQYTSDPFAINELCFWGCVWVTEYSVTISE